MHTWPTQWFAMASWKTYQWMVLPRQIMWYQFIDFGRMEGSIDFPKIWSRNQTSGAHGWRRLLRIPYDTLKYDDANKCNYKKKNNIVAMRLSWKRWRRAVKKSKILREETKDSRKGLSWETNRSQRKPLWYDNNVAPPATKWLLIWRGSCSKNSIFFPKLENWHRFRGASHSRLVWSYSGCSRSA